MTYPDERAQSDLTTKPAPQISGVAMTINHDTTKAAILHADSRLLPEWARRTFDRARAGKEVDAWWLHCATVLALSTAATRYGQSMARRKLTSDCRHILYKTGAAVGNQLAQLPPHVEGPRSPRISELEKIVVQHEETIKALEADVEQRDSEVQHLTDQVKVIGSELDTKRETSSIAERRLAIIRQQEEEIKGHMELSVTRADQIDFLYSILDAEQKEAFDGFKVGYSTAQNRFSR